ncbi:MAG: hypothetical protein XE11_2630, partial [Methanomicrobiales archaeon 53_19]
PNISPRATENDMESTATILEKVFLRSVAVIASS